MAEEEMRRSVGLKITKTTPALTVSEYIFVQTCVRSESVLTSKFDSFNFVLTFFQSLVTSEFVYFLPSK
jgi:hypothetical protein